MGAVDLVVQVESPPSVACGLQRVGRAGHQVGAVSRGVVFPKYRGDLVQTAVVAERMRDGRDRGAAACPRNPLDVLAQQIVAMVAMDAWQVDELGALVRRAAPFASLPGRRARGGARHARRPLPERRVRRAAPAAGVGPASRAPLTGRPGRAAARGDLRRHDPRPRAVRRLPGRRRQRPGRRVGELDEEMVYESRVGDVFTLGSSSWRIEDITHDRVLVSPAPGQPGRLPFWHGDALGRPAELGRAVGAFVREVGALPPDGGPRAGPPAGLDDWAADNLLAYLREQREATGHVPDDRTIVVERFRDELGDWRVVVHSPFGAQVHAPWALAVGARLRERFGVDVQAMHGDDGHRAAAAGRRDRTTGRPARRRVRWSPFEPDGVERPGHRRGRRVGPVRVPVPRVRGPGAAAAAPRRPGRRTAAVAAAPARRAAARRWPAGTAPSRSSWRPCASACRTSSTSRPRRADARHRGPAGPGGRGGDRRSRRRSPAALLFGYVAQFLYEGDSPLAERRAAALALDPALLAELLGRARVPSCATCSTRRPSAAPRPSCSA